MAIDFKSARKNCWETDKTVGGVSLAGHPYDIYYDGYRHCFCNQLDLMGYGSDQDYCDILTQMNEHLTVGSFLSDETQQLAELSAFGLLTFERLVLAEARNAPYEEIFRLHEALCECQLYVILSDQKRIVARRGAQIMLANSPKQKFKSVARKYWDDWKVRPQLYRGKAEFARDMIEKSNGVMESHRVIEGWCRTWELNPDIQLAK